MNPLLEQGHLPAFDRHTGWHFLRQVLEQGALANQWISLIYLLFLRMRV